MLGWADPSTAGFSLVPGRASLCSDPAKGFLVHTGRQFISPNICLDSLVPDLLQRQGEAEASSPASHRVTDQIMFSKQMHK